MGFLRRFFGPPELALHVTYFKRIRDDASLQVVGEAYRQELVLQARPPGPDDMPPGIPPPPPGQYKATLIPEPSNPHDRNAIRVALWAGRSWVLVGYLSRESAVEYQPIFRHLAPSAGDRTASIACDAALISERGGTGVVLHLGSPGECIAELLTDDLAPIGHELVGKYIAFTGDRATNIHGVPLDRPGQVMLGRWAGCEVLPRLTKKTDALIVADASYSTSNLQKAREYQVPVIDEREFLVSVGIPESAVARASARWAHG
jgi:hypothetical protein